MGDGRKRDLRVQFDRRLKLEFHGAKITSNGGLFLHRELDDAPRLRIGPAMRRVAGGRARKCPAASISQMSRFETEMLVSEMGNFGK